VKALLKLPIKDIVLLVLFVLIIGFTILGHDAKSIAEAASRSGRAENIFYGLIILLHIFFLLRFIRFIRRKSLLNGILSISWIVVTVAGFISGYSSRAVAQILSRSEIAETLFFVILVSAIVIVGLWMIARIYTHIINNSKQVN